MDFSLIICTYMRPKAIINLLDSVQQQELYPNEIIIVDGSIDDLTSEAINKKSYKNIYYFKVDDQHRGLTKQRNFGIEKVSKSSDIISFLDDDTELTKKYFFELIETYKKNPEITGVGGIAVNENNWKELDEGKKYPPKKYYMLDGFVLKEGTRNVARNYLGLQSNLAPGLMPTFSHGRSSNFPLNEKIYEVDLLIGMSFSFHKKVFENIKFSTYFEGYGLYEDADYSLRALKYGKNVVNTKVKMYHFHNPQGRPNKFKYGKMVVRNGWYVWRVKYEKTKLTAKLKWNLITLLLMIIRLTNVLTTKKRSEAFYEFLGRFVGWITLFYDKPKIER